MQRVYIPGPYMIPFQRQLKNTDHIWGNTKFVFDGQSEYDYIAVLDNIVNPIYTKCPKEKRLLFLGEPPMVKRYTKNYLNQFGYVYSCQRQLVDKHKAIKLMPMLPWMLGCTLKKSSHLCSNNDYYMSYNDFSNFRNEDRINKVCIITSNKVFTKGHRDRVRFVERIVKDKIDYIDIYGNGYSYIEDKFDILSKYRYSIVIENCQYPDYWTEKLADCILSGCCPIYYGANNIDTYFPNYNFPRININDYKISIKQVELILRNDFYCDYVKHLDYLKGKILNDYNLFSVIDKLVSNLKVNENACKEDTVLYPMKYNFSEKILSKIHWYLNI